MVGVRKPGLLRADMRLDDEVRASDVRLVNVAGDVLSLYTVDTRCRRRGERRALPRGPIGRLQFRVCSTIGFDAEPVLPQGRRRRHPRERVPCHQTEPRPPLFLPGAPRQRRAYPIRRDHGPLH